MNRHKLAILSVVAVVGVAAALWSTQTRKPAQETSGVQPLVTGLQAALNDVTQVRLSSAGDTTFATLTRSDAGWTLAEKGGYAVDTAKVRDLLGALGNAKRVEAKTANAELYAKLAVEDVSAAQAKGVLVAIEGPAQPAGVIVGHTALRGKGTFVRLADQAQSWQTDDNIEVERDAAKWLQPDIIDVAPSRVAAVTITPPTGAPVALVRASGDGAADFTLRNLPKGRELASEFVADATAQFLSGLRLDDVVPADQAQPGETPVTTSVFTLDDGSSITLTTWVADGKTFARLQSTLDETAAVAAAEAAHVRAGKEAAALAQTLAADAAADGNESDADAAAPTAETAPAATLASTEDRLAALRERVAAQQATFARWTYVLPSYKAGNLNKSLEDYLKPKG